MDKTTNKEQYVWYSGKTVENGWSRNTLVMQIESDLYARQLGAKIHNFSKLLPDKQSDLAVQTMKDPYIFDFCIEHYNEILCFTLLGAFIVCLKK